MHGPVGLDPTQASSRPASEAQTYRVSFLWNSTAIHFLVERYQGRAFNCTNLQINFAHRHVRETIIILEEGSRPRPCFPECNIFVPWKVLNGWHPYMAMCARGWEMKRKHLAAEDAQAEVEVVVFQAYKCHLSTVWSFKYMVRVLTAVYDNWAAVISNLMKLQKRWVKFSCILGKEVANVQVYGLFYKAMVQSVLIYRSEMWVLMPQMVRTLGNFHHRVARNLIRWKLRQQANKGWFYPPLEKDMQEVRLEEI